MKRGYLIAILGIAVLCGCSKGPAMKPEASVAAPLDLAAHSQEFRKEIIRVAEGVHVAVGFGLANSVLLEGRDGVVIVDTMESAEAAQPVKEAFEEFANEPSDKSFEKLVFSRAHMREIKT